MIIIGSLALIGDIVFIVYKFFCSNKSEKSEYKQQKHNESEDNKKPNEDVNLVHKINRSYNN